MRVNKQSKKCGLKCPDHTFSFKPYLNGTFYKQDIQIMYCPKFNIQSPSPDNFFPQFNNDGKAFTPAFILSVDKSYYYQNDTKLLLEHNKKIIDCQQKKQILFPKPSRKYKYCSVCKKNYEDYMEHIKQTSHKKSIASSKFNTHILDLCKDLFNNEPRKEVIVIKDQDPQSSQYNQKRNSFPSTQYERPPYKKRHLQNDQININQPNDFMKNYFFPNELLNNQNFYQLWNTANLTNTNNFSNNNFNNHQYFPYGQNYFSFPYNPLNLNLYNGTFIPNMYPMQQQIVPMQINQIPHMNTCFSAHRVRHDIPQMNHQRGAIQPSEFQKTSKNLIVIED